MLLKYGACHDASDAAVPGVCFVAQATNDGLLHLFDAATGRETSAIVPAELCPLGRVAKHRLERIMDQPTASVIQRYFVDGELRLFHDDLDGDTVIDDGEPARLVFGLGRGGTAYHQLDVGRLAGGVVTTENNPIHPLVATKGTAFEELRETWHAPYVGRAIVAGAKHAYRRVRLGPRSRARRPRRHARHRPRGPAAPALHGRDAHRRVCRCRGLRDRERLRGRWHDAVQRRVPTGVLGTRASPCYDTGYWSTSPAAALPLTLQFRPAALRDRDRAGRCVSAPLRPLRPRSGRHARRQGCNVVAGEYRLRDLDGGGWTEWIYDTEDLGFYLELETDGVDTANTGVLIGAVEWRVATKESVVAAVPAHNPTLFVVDVNR